ncbi:MAG: hypothetical protein ACMUHM_02890, partial [Thermoplasmatota archaeon]
MKWRGANRLFVFWIVLILSAPVWIVGLSVDPEKAKISGWRVIPEELDQTTIRIDGEEQLL